MTDTMWEITADRAAMNVSAESAQTDTDKKTTAQTGATSAPKDEYKGPAQPAVQPASKPAENATPPKKENWVKRKLKGILNFFGISSSNSQSGEAKKTVVAEVPKTRAPQVGDCLEYGTTIGVRCY